MRCDRCQGVGYIETPAGWSRCLCTKREMVFSNAGIPERFRTMLRDVEPLDDQRDLVRKLRIWCETWKEHRTGLAFSGDVGTGKSFLMAAVLAELAAAHGQQVRWFHVQALREGAKEAMADEEAEDVLWEAQHAEVLALDDLGAEAATQWWGETLAELIDARYAAKAATLYTTNCTQAELVAVYGNRTVDRLTAMVRGLLLTGTSHRTKPELQAPKPPDVVVEQPTRDESPTRIDVLVEETGKHPAKMLGSLGALADFDPEQIRLAAKQAKEERGGKWATLEDILTRLGVAANG